MNGVEKICDEILADNVRNNACSDSFSEIYRRHIGLYYKICQKFMQVLLQHGFSQDDLNNDSRYVIFQAIRCFDKTKKIKLSSWIGTYTRYHCLNLINKEATGFTLLDEKQHSEENLTAETSYLIEYINDMLNMLKDQRISKIFQMRYFGRKNKTPWKEIGEQLGVSNQTVINLHRKGAQFLKTKLKSGELFDKF